MKGFELLIDLDFDNGFVQQGSVQAVSSRSTGLETVNVNVLSDYYDRGENMTLSVTSLNLDHCY